MLDEGKGGNGGRLLIAAALSGLALSGLALWCGAAGADTLPPSARTGAASGEAARAPTLSVDPAACRWVRRHEPSADVAYTPGVDSRGRAVAPADLAGGQSLVLPETLEIAITVPLAERFGIPKDSLFKAEAHVGTVAVTNGRVLFNGRPVSPAAEEELVALCRKQGVGR